MYRFKQPSAPNTTPDQKPEQTNRNTTPGGISWKKALAIAAVPLALLFGAAFQSSNSVPGQLHAIQDQLSALQAQVTSLANKGPRKFYLTKTDYDGAHALSACAMGYHMASLREIFDTSNLRYDTNLGLTKTDSGFGPPNGSGWIRTGTFANAFSQDLGTPNCSAWTSANAQDVGTGVGLFSGWDIPGQFTSPWRSSFNSCNLPAPVWCVQD